MRLFEISEQLEALLNASVNPETGEVDEAALAELDALEMERDAKALAVAAYMLGQQAESDAIKAQAERLMKRARVHANHAERLKRYIADHLPVGHKCADDRVALSWRKSQAVEVDGVDALDANYLRVVAEPDKKAIGDDLKAGVEVKGARLVTRHSLVVK